MCTHPVRITNPKLNWTERDQKYIEVPCGKCSECRRKKQTDWYLRASAEAMLYKQSGGHVFMATLTYNNQSLPHFYDADVQFSVTAFFQPHLTSFQKMFRLNVQRTYNVCPDNIKFFISCEFGEKNHRPHYHTLVYIPYSWFDDFKFLEIARKTWKHGFVMKSKDLPWEVQTMNAVQYVCKYVTKDLYFFNKYINEYLDKHHLSQEEYQRRKSLIKDYLPRLRTPHNFGISIAEEILLQKDPIEFLVNNQITMPSRDGNIFKHSIPNYVKQKLTKQLDTSVSSLLGRNYYRSTLLGRELQSSKLERQFINDQNTLLKFKDPLYISSTLNQEENSDYNTIKSLSETLSTLINSVDTHRLSIYKNLLRFLPIECLGRHKIDYYFEKETLHTIMEQLTKEKIPYELYEIIRSNTTNTINTTTNTTTTTLTNLSYPIDCEVGLPTEQIENFKDYKTFSDNPLFMEYEKCCILLDFYTQYHSQQLNKAKDKKDKLIKEIREFYKKYNIGYSTQDKYYIKT